MPNKLQIRITHINELNRATNEIRRAFVFKTNAVIYIPALFRHQKCKNCGRKLTGLYILIIKGLHDAGLLAEDYIDNNLLCCCCYENKDIVEKGKDRKI